MRDKCFLAWRNVKIFFHKMLSSRGWKCNIEWCCDVCCAQWGCDWVDRAIVKLILSPTGRNCHSAENSPDEWCIAIYSIHKAFEYDICGVRWNLISHFAQCNTCRVVSLQQIVIAIFSSGLRKLSNGKRDATCTERCFVCKLMRWRWWFTTDQTTLVSRFCPRVHFLFVAQKNRNERHLMIYVKHILAGFYVGVKRRNTVDNVNVHVAPKWKKGSSINKNRFRRWFADDIVC